IWAYNPSIPRIPLAVLHPAVPMPFCPPLTATLLRSCPSGRMIAGRRAPEESEKGEFQQAVRLLWYVSLFTTKSEHLGTFASEDGTGASEIFVRGILKKSGSGV